MFHTEVALAARTLIIAAAAALAALLSALLLPDVPPRAPPPPLARLFERHRLLWERGEGGWWLHTYEKGGGRRVVAHL